MLLALPSIPTNRPSTAPRRCGHAMIQMASVFGEQERQIIRSRVLAGLDRVRQQGKKLGRPKVSPQGRGSHPRAFERGEWHPQGCGDGQALAVAPCSG